MKALSLDLWRYDTSIYILFGDRELLIDVIFHICHLSHMLPHFLEIPDYVLLRDMKTY